MPVASNSHAKKQTMFAILSIYIHTKLMSETLFSFKHSSHPNSITSFRSALSVTSDTLSAVVLAQRTLNLSLSHAQHICAGTIRGACAMGKHVP